MLAAGRRVPAGDARVRRHGRAGRLVRPRRHRASIEALTDGPAARQRSARGWPRSGQGADEGQPRGARPLRRRADGVPRICRRSAAGRPGAGPGRLGGGARRGIEERLRHAAERLRATAWNPSGGCCWTGTGSSTWPARSSGWAASAPGRGCCCCSATTAQRPAVPAGQGGGRRRCWRSSSGPASTTTAGSGSSSGQRLMQAVSDIFLGWVRVEVSTGSARLLPAPAAGLEGIGRGRDDGPGRDAGLRRALRLDAGPRPRPLRRPHRDRGLPRRRRRLRRGRRASSPRPTPTRTSATTRRWWTRSRRGRIVAETGV